VPNAHACQLQGSRVLKDNTHASYMDLVCSKTTRPLSHDIAFKHGFFACSANDVGVYEHASKADQRRPKAAAHFLL
jgi:hypothetical protein